MRPVRLRLARAGEAAALARLELAGLAGRLPAEQAGRRWAEQLALPAGDDHFVLVAELAAGGVAGFASAGGSRDGDGKGDGELYAMAVDPASGLAAEVAGALVGEVVDRLGRAGYARATCWVGSGGPAGDGAGVKVVRAALEQAGFAVETAGTWRDGAGRWRLARRLGTPAGR